MCSLIQNKDNLIELDRAKLSEVLTNMELPPYRRIFTGGTFFLILRSGDKVDAKFTLPSLSLQVGKSSYKRYLNPDELNILMQAKFDNWEEDAKEFFENKLGFDFKDADNGEPQNVVYERTKLTKEEPDVTELVQDLHNWHSIALKKFNDDSDEDVYIRLENYALVLGDCANLQNLVFRPFSFGKDLPVMLSLHEGNYDIPTMFAEEIKIFYNQPNNMWRVFLDLGKVQKNLPFKDHMKLPQGEDFPKCVPMHLDSFNLSIYIQMPSIYYCNEETNWHEKKVQLTAHEVKMLSETKFEDIEEFLVERYQLKGEFST